MLCLLPFCCRGDDRCVMGVAMAVCCAMQFGYERGDDPGQRVVLQDVRVRSKADVVTSSFSAGCE